VQQLLDLDAALTMLLERLEPPRDDSETVALHASRNRVTAADVTAPVSLPPFDSSAMDGYAVRTVDFSGEPPHPLDVQGVSLAGTPAEGPLAPNCTIRIFTGAAVPEGADAIIMQENTYTESNRLFTTQTPTPGQNIRTIGNDVSQGDLLIAQGEPLGPFQHAWLSACGIRELAVFPKLRVSIFATGDELIEPGQPLAPGQIYESNRPVLVELMSDLPVAIQDLGILPDDPDTLRTAMSNAAEHSDVILTSGGVSVGDEDHIRPVVESIGHLEFWKLALKPGKPMAYGNIGDAAFFGLPGNPVSTIVTFLLIVKPALQSMSGMQPQPVIRLAAQLRSPIRHSAGRVEYQRGTLALGADGATVTNTGDQSSNRLGSFRNANCLIEVPKTEGDLEPGASVQVLPFSGLLY
jgi:molybdopterin molybdotransferase